MFSSVASFFKTFTFYNIYIKTIPFVPATLISMLFTFYNIYIKTKFREFIEKVKAMGFTFYNIYIKTEKSF